MSIFDYNDPIISRLRKNTIDDPYVSKTEYFIIENGKVVLTELPSKFHRVTVSGDGITWIEKDKKIENSNEFMVDYTNKIITFDAIHNGKQLQFDYTGRGLQYLPTSMIYTKTTNGEVTETLENIIATGESAIENIQILDQKIKEVDNLITETQYNEVWSSTTTYSKNNIVSLNGSSFISLKDNNINNNPNPDADTLYWGVLAKKGDQGSQGLQGVKGDKGATLTPRGLYDPAVTYQYGDLVTYDGSTYYAIQTTTGNLPTNITYWEVFMNGGGDMQKDTYDTNNNGQVDKADDSDKLGGQLPSYYAKATELHSHTNKDSLDRLGVDASNNLTIDGNLYESGAKINDATTSTTTAWSSQKTSDEISVLSEELLTYKNDVAVNVKDFGAVGDGITDDTTSILNAINSGNRIVFDKNANYKVTNTILISKGIEININGSIINFELSSTIPAFSIKSDNVKIHNGTINVVGTVMGGDGTSLNCIVAGNQGNGVGYRNLHFSELTVSTNRNDAGATIGVLGECSNVVIENINVPDNANCRNVIGCEWGGTTSGTGHPHNIKINNIKVGKLTYPTSGSTGYGYVVWLSSTFNVEITNIIAEECFGLVGVMTGDKSNDYAPVSYKDKIGRNIILNNLTCESIYGYPVRVYGKGSQSENVLDQSAEITNLYAKARIGEVISGVTLEYCRNVKLSKFILDGFNFGFSTGANCERPLVENGIILNSKVYGLNFGSSNGICENPIARNIHFQGNNANNGAGTGTSAIVLNNVTKPVVEYCTFGEIGVNETQKYSIFIGANSIFARINENHTYNLALNGVAYVNNVSTTPDINTFGTNNTSEVGLNNQGGAPIFQKSITGARIFWGSTIPTSGTYDVGDIMYFTLPTASGHIGAVCVTSGSPGTWKNFGAITS